MLTPQRLREITSLLNAAFEREPSAREAFIREASHGDQALRDLALRVLHETRARTGPLTGEPTPEDVLTRILHEEIGSLERNAGSAEARFIGGSRFQVRRRLGSGGFGTVYEAYDHEQKNFVALKVLRRATAAFLYRFKREFRTLVDIRHPNLVELYELFSADDSWFFTMELVHGVDFLSYVQSRSGGDAETGTLPCDVARLRAASLQLATGIAALHAAGIVHRDIKPSNVLVTGSGCVRVLDFGLAQEIDRSPLQSLTIVGTPAYMSPEQLAGLPVAEPTDWYSFGLVMFQALTGSLPIHRDLAGGSALSRPIVGAAEDLDLLCRALLHHDPMMRPSSHGVIERLGGTADAPGVQAGNVAVTEEVVGREEELRRLEAWSGEVTHGRAVIVNVSGTSGMGKTALLRAFRRRLTQDYQDVVCLAGRCHESETVPFKALDDLIDGLSKHLERLSREEAEQITPRDAQYLIRLFPVLGQVDAIADRPGTPDIADSHELRERAFAGLHELLVRLAHRCRVVLVIDDLQWGDLESAAFIRRLLTASVPPPVLLVASYRSDDADHSPFLASWRSYLADAELLVVHDIELTALTPEDARRLTARLLMLDPSSDDPRIQSIVEESAGSPFLIEQLATVARRALADGLSVVGMRRVVENRLGNLRPEARRLLEIVALGGGPIPYTAVCAAAGLDSPDYPILSGLAVEHLIRVRDANGGREVEIYHDRIRTALVGAMSAAERQQEHLSLARALERESVQNPALLAAHFLEAGKRDTSVRYALAAADQAVGALAFERAARFFQLALEEGHWSTAESVGLKRRLARALADAGQGANAARVYLEAAGAVSSLERLELRRLASAQLLRSGNVDEGLEVLRTLARTLRIWLPASRWQAILSLLMQRVRVSLRPLRFQSRSPTASDVTDAAVLDVYWSLVIGLGMVDPVQSLDFQARHLLLALRVGDRDRVAMSLATEAAHRATSRRRDPVRMHALLADAYQLSAGTKHGEAPGLIGVMDALCALLTGEWRRAWELSVKAESILREKCIGVAWERAENNLVGVSAAIHLGEWSKLSAYAERLPKLVQEAKAAGDLHTVCSVLGGAHLVCLASDRPQAAEEMVLNVVSAFRSDRFSVQQFNLALEAQVDTALYRRDARRAWQLVTSMWPQLSASLVLRVQYVSIMAFHLRARAALAVAAEGGDARPYVREASRCARRIERERMPWGDVLAAGVRAGVSSFGEDRRDTMEWLARAERGARRADMALWVAACQCRRGTVLGGSEGAALMAEADAWANRERVVNPTGIFDMFLPGRFVNA